VEKVLDEAVSEDGESRYADAGELRRALVGAGLGRGGRRDLPPSGTTGALEAMPATSQLPAITVGTARPRGRRVVFALVAVAVVAAVAVTVLLRGDGDGANPADGEPAARPTASSASLGEVIPGIDAPSLPEAEGETPTLDEVLADAEGANLGLTGQNVIDRLQARQNLEGDERAAETADLFGTAAVAYASAAPWADLAEQVVAHLRPEVTVESLLALAGRDPSLLDPFFTRLVSGLEEMVALQGAERAQVAQELLPDLELAATEGTLTPALAAATAEVLDRAQEEAGEAPAEEAPAGPPPPEPPPPG
jgi:hypothetical protein